MEKTNYDGRLPHQKSVSDEYSTRKLRKQRLLLCLAAKADPGDHRRANPDLALWRVDFRA